MLLLSFLSALDIDNIVPVERRWGKCWLDGEGELTHDVQHGGLWDRFRTDFIEFVWIPIRPDRKAGHPPDLLKRLHDRTEEAFPLKLLLWGCDHQPGGLRHIREHDVHLLGVEEWVVLGVGGD